MLQRLKKSKRLVGPSSDEAFTRPLILWMRGWCTEDVFFRKKWQLSLHFYSVRKRLSRFSFLPSASPRSCSNYRSSKLNGSNIQHNLLKKFFIQKTIFPLSGGFCWDLLLPSFTLGNDIHSFRECWTTLILLRCLLLCAPSYFSYLHKRLMWQT